MAGITPGMATYSEADQRHASLREYGLVPDSDDAGPAILSGKSLEPLQSVVELAAKLRGASPTPPPRRAPGRSACWKYLPPGGGGGRSGHRPRSPGRALLSAHRCQLPPHRRDARGRPELLQGGRRPARSRLPCVGRLPKSPGIRALRSDPVKCWTARTGCASWNRWSGSTAMATATGPVWGWPSAGELPRCTTAS